MELSNVEYKKIPLRLTTYEHIHYIAGMKKTRRNTYRIVEELPADAMRVSEYAVIRECNTSYIYELVKKGGEIGFEIVVYKGINFVLVNK